MIQRLLLAGLLLVATGCDSSTSEADTGTYRATLFDAEDAPVYEGELRLVIDAEGPEDAARDVSGTWTLQGVGDQPDPDPASGALAGRLSAGRIVLTLQTGASDSGIELDGAYSSDRVEGTWSRITIAGPVPAGAFVAVQD